MFDIDQALITLVSRSGSDLHLKVGSVALARIGGALGPLVENDAYQLTAEDVDGAMRKTLHNTLRLEEFAAEQEVDYSYEIEEVARFRINAFRQRNAISMVYRMIPHEIPSIDDLALSPVLRDIADEERGMILLTGATGSGKSTTLAAMVDHINTTRSCHIVTIEDPIEFIHQDKRSVVNQREVGSDTKDFARALRRVFRQDPDVILIGELRDEETARTALSAAETGHLVLSTVHTADAGESINRLLDFFPPHQHPHMRAVMGGALKAIISQRLVPGVDGGRIAAVEVLRMTSRVRDMISDPAKTGQLNDVIADGAYYGMETFDQNLFGHVKAGRVSVEDAITASTSPHDFKLLLAAGWRRGTSMEDIDEAGENAKNAEEAQRAIRAV